jgi:hypothetical protein
MKHKENFFTSNNTLLHRNDLYFNSAPKKLTEQTIVNPSFKKKTMANPRVCIHHRTIGN